MIRVCLLVTWAPPFQTRLKFDGVSTTSSEERSGRQFCVFLLVLCVCAVAVSVIALTLMRHRGTQEHADGFSASADRESMHRLSYEVLKKSKPGINELENEDVHKYSTGGNP